ncbi:MAG: universal stress protein [Desulfobacterales bacterium]|nr:universal stress protein [Desulfobacteraceae bacterium]MDD3992579.1 universal stress protein [Desulfobacteraceae bacterium]MDY0312991.1 universal stress protein [Desulfobacterales bacterium]
MPRNQHQRVLMALDGSQRSLEAVRHVARSCPFQHMDIVLFHVFSNVPECYYDLEKEPKAVKVVTAVRAWEVEQRKQIKAQMEKAKDILVAHGIDEGHVHIVIRKRQIGVARDIVREAESGYDAVIIRRRGVGAMRALVMGSVATKLLEKLDFVPVLIIGRHPCNNRILVCMDGSACAMRALEFVARRLGCGDFHVHLLHVIRARGRGGFGVASDTDAECAAKAEAAMEKVFDEGRRILEAGGVDPTHITTRVVRGALSRAAAIAEEAKTGDYATIVLGRRGLSGVKDFFMGRVSHKVIYAARQHSVWIVN